MENMPGMDHSSPDDHHDQMAMTSHMTFFWGKNAEILFSGWPGTRTGMYVLALIIIFLLSVLVEWLSNCSKIVNNKRSSGVVVIRTIVHGIRIGLGYLVMLAVMSFNVGVLIVAVAGHTFGFFLFGSRVSNKSDDDSDKGFPPRTGC